MYNSTRSWRKHWAFPFCHLCWFEFPAKKIESALDNNWSNTSHVFLLEKKTFSARKSRRWRFALNAFLPKLQVSYKRRRKQIWHLICCHKKNGSTTGAKELIRKHLQWSLCLWPDRSKVWSVLDWEQVAEKRAASQPSSVLCRIQPFCQSNVYSSWMCWWTKQNIWCNGSFSARPFQRLIQFMSLFAGCVLHSSVGRPCQVLIWSRSQSPFEKRLFSCVSKSAWSKSVVISVLHCVSHDEYSLPQTAHQRKFATNAIILGHRYKKDKFQRWCFGNRKDQMPSVVEGPGPRSHEYFLGTWGETDFFKKTSLGCRPELKEPVISTWSSTFMCKEKILFCLPLFGCWWKQNGCKSKLCAQSQFGPLLATKNNTLTDHIFLDGIASSGHNCSGLVQEKTRMWENLWNFSKIFLVALC